MIHTLTLDHHHVPEFGGYAVRALLELQGRPPASANHIPLRLCVVLDRSGSMRGEPLEAATRAAADVVRRLAPEDIVSVVSFDDRVETVIAPHKGGDEQAVTERILAIESGGSTNLSGGWLRGRELVTRDRVEGAVHRVLLLTDGHANAGIVDYEQLAALAAESRTKGVTTTCVGFGEEYDDALLKAMSDAGGGNLFHIERADQAALAFGDELAGLQSLAGQNLSVTVNIAEEVTLVRVHHDWPHSDNVEGRTFELGDLYSREPKRMLVEFFCANPPAAGSLRMLARLTLRADVREADGSIVHERIELPIAATLEGAGQESPVIEREVLLTRAAQARANAAQSVREGDVETATRTLAEARVLIESSPLATEMGDELRDLQVLELKFVRESATEGDARYLDQKAYNARRGKRGYDAGFTRPEE